MKRYDLFSNFYFSCLFNVSELYIKWIGLEKYRNKYFCEFYQNNYKIYLDEYESNEPEIETDNFFYERFMRRK